MALTKKPLVTKKTIPTLKKTSDVATTKNASEKEEATKKTYFASYQLSNEITKENDFYAEVKKHVKTDKSDFILFSPYRYKGEKKVYFEDVFLNLDLVNNPTSAAGQFISLFAEARNWGDIHGRIVGIHVKPQKGKDDVIFKNIVKVFETEEDELIFDDEHMAYPVMTKKTSEGKSINDVLDEPDDEMEDTVVTEEEDDAEAETPSQSKFSDEIFDEDDVDDEDWEEE